MKKIVLTSILSFALLSSFTAFSQKKPNKFRGTVKLEISSKGQKMEQSYKVFDSKLYAKTSMGGNIVNGNVAYSIFDFSQIIPALQSMGYDEIEGNGKMFIKKTFYIDSILKNVKDVEYTSETKSIHGFETKKAIIKGASSDEDGDGFSIEVWYSEEIGPEYNIAIIPYVKGFPLEVIQKNAEGETMYTIETKAIEKGKVKEAELLLPVGFEETSMDQVNKVIQILQELREARQ